MVDERRDTEAVSWDEWDMADRMKRALRLTGISVQQMATDLGVERGTVGSWINGRIVPRKATVMAFALRTGAPFEWLWTGTPGNDKAPDPEGSSASDVHPLGLEPRTH
ncbi:helix-turn-helix domain-containing protein [Herbiconiux flava]|uniref:helix-turn-helix domain-containing protein n=1 Tax=Herbiconiux flava TaxID=881268 RepID=UPI0015CE0964|nr:helix-turn-helix transcriptional regulator [Herbiconiux flava]